MRSKLLIFLKAPVPGGVKTRLAREIGGRAAARAYVAMARAVAKRARALRGVELVWVYQAAPGFADLGWLGRPAGRVWPQSPGDLGARLADGFGRAFRRGARRVCAIGTDSPDLPSRRIARAFSLLRRADAVVGPCQDGGYYLIGLARPSPGLFEGIPWSSSRVAAATRWRARSLGLSLAELEPHYDVDSTRGLLRWLSAGRSPAVTALVGAMGKAGLAGRPAGLGRRHAP